MLRSRTNWLASWIAMLAIVFASLAPTVSQAMSSHDHANVIYQKVCSEHGTKIIPIELPSGKHHDGMLGQSGHCTLCCTSHHTPIVSAGVAVITLSLNESHAWFVAAYDSPIIEATHQGSHPPQAPPVI